MEINHDEGIYTLDHVYDSRHKQWTKALVINPPGKMAKTKVCK